MAAIKSKDTEPEKYVRSLLHRAGFRFRKNHAKLPGKPDIYLPKWNCVIFVNGCFWHRHVNCKYSTNPKTNIDFWNKKFESNIERDARIKTVLENMGLKVIIVWECSVKVKDTSLLKWLADKITAPRDLR